MSTACMFHQHLLILRVIAQQCWISFEAAAHFRELESQFFNKWLTDECMCFVSGKLFFSYSYIMLLIVLNKNGSLTLIRIFRSLICGVCVCVYEWMCVYMCVCVCVCVWRGEVKLSPCLKLLKITLETWNLVGKYTHKFSFRKNTF